LVVVWAKSFEELVVGHRQETIIILLGSELSENLFWSTKESDFVLLVSLLIFRSWWGLSLGNFIFLHEDIRCESQTWE
jgi:hypothetical protein